MIKFSEIIILKKKNQFTGIDESLYTPIQGLSSTEHVV